MKAVQKGLPAGIWSAFIGKGARLLFASGGSRVVGLKVVFYRRKPKSKIDM